MPQKRSFKQKIFPLAIERGNNARELRAKGVIRFIFEGTHLDLPLKNQNGFLQGVFVVPSGKFKGRLLSFRFNEPYNLDIFLLEKNNELPFDRLGEVGFRGSGHRLVPTELRRMGVATKALDILEPHLAMHFDRLQKTHSNKVVAATIKKDTAAFLKKRGYVPSVRLEKINRQEFDNLTGDQPAKDFEHLGQFHNFGLLIEKEIKAKHYHSISKYHRIQIIGVDAKPKYLYIKVRE